MAIMYSLSFKSHSILKILLIQNYFPEIQHDDKSVLS